MSITTKQVTRVFRQGGTEYPDPAPGCNPERALEILAIANPSLNNAALEGPSFESGKEVFQIKTNVGTKG